MATEHSHHAWYHGSGGAEAPYHPARIRKNRTLVRRPATEASSEPGWQVRPHNFFVRGRVFAVIWSETAGETADAGRSGNSSFSEVKSGHYAYTNTRRFVVVLKLKEFCYACPIYTYGGRATTKPGVRMSEHGLIYTYGQKPRDIPDGQYLKQAVAVKSNSQDKELAAASRIYYGIQYPVQYNIKVKDLGFVVPEDVNNLYRNWWEEVEAKMISRTAPAIDSMNWGSTSQQNSTEAAGAEETDSLVSPVTSQVSDLERVKDPKAFFKKGRVFMTLWSEPKGSSEAEIGAGDQEQSFTEIARFAVVRTKTTHCVCLRISTYSGKATTKQGVTASEHAVVLPWDPTESEKAVLHPKGEQGLKEKPIFVLVENDSVTIDKMSRINFGKPYTVEHNVKIRKIGRVAGDSLQRMEEYFAESLGFQKPEPSSGI